MKNFDQKAILNSIRNKCIKQSLTIAIAESVTSGLMQNYLSRAVDAMQFFQGGITVYNLGQKSRQLNVNPIICEQTNSVSKVVSEKLAIAVAEKFSAEIGIGITGYAISVPELGIKQKHAFLAIVKNDQLIVSQKIIGLEEDNLEKNQIHFVQKSLEILAKNI